MDFTFTEWPNVDRLIWTGVTLAAAVAIGYVINLVFVRRIQKLTQYTQGDWDDAIVLEIRKRVPFWSVLVGLWLSIGRWPFLAGLPQERIQPWDSFVPGAIKVLAALSVTTAAAAIAVRLLTAFSQVNPHVPVSGLMRNVVRIVVFTIGFLVVLRGVGVEITPMLAALGVGGLAVALALQEPLSNLFAGLFITIAGQIRIGDFIKLEPGPEGVVADFSWNATQLTTPAGNVVIVPNAKVIQAIVINYHRPARDMGFSVEFTVAPDSNLSEVERIGVEVATKVLRDVTGAMRDAEPSVRFLGYSELGLRCAVNLRARDYGDQALVRHELIKHLQPALKAAGIELSTVQFMRAPSTP